MPPLAAQTSLAESFVEAQELGRRDEKDPVTVDYHRGTLLPQFSASYRAHLRECQAALPQPDQTPFSFVAALDAEGKVLKLWSDRSPPVYSCLRGRLLVRSLSAAAARAVLSLRPYAFRELGALPARELATGFESCRRRRDRRRHPFRRARSTSALARQHQR